MKKLLSIIVLGLLLSGNAYSKIIDLQCKYVSGHITNKIPHPNHEDSEANTTYVPISDTGVEDYKIKLDTTKQKIIEAPDYVEGGSTHGFNEDIIMWYASLASESRLEIKYTLNRYTGRLREYHIHYKWGETETNYWANFIYDCTKAKRLF